MRRVHPVVVATALLVALGALAASRVAGVADASLAMRLAGAALGTAAAVHLVERIPGAVPARDAPEDAIEALWRRGSAPAAAPEPRGRQRLGRLVRLTVASADYAHVRLRPLLRELADARYEAAYGTHPDTDARAPARIGAAAWAWVRPDRPEPIDRHGRGPPLEELDEVVTALERIGADRDARRHEDAGDG